MGPVSFVHPLLLGGLLAAAVPTLLHLFGRRQTPTIPFAALDFLLALDARLAGRQRLRRFLVWLLRTLAVAALCLALARPLRTAALSSGPAAPRRVAIVLDHSASMAYRTGDRSALDGAKARALGVLHTLQPGDRAALVLAGATVRAAVAPATTQLEVLREAIVALKVTAGVADLGAAIELGRQSLGPAAAASGDDRIVVVGDLAKNSFVHLQAPAAGPSAALSFVDASAQPGAKALPNVALSGLQVQPARGLGTPTTRKLQLSAHNFGAAAIAARAYTLCVDGRVVQRGSLDLPPRGAAQRLLTHDFGAPGDYSVEVRLSGDGYIADDVLQLRVHLPRGLRVLALNGEARQGAYDDELYFVERAYLALPEGDAPIDLQVAGVQQNLDVAALRDIDVVLLANVPTLSDAQRAGLKDFVGHGGGLLITLGPQVRFEACNQSYADLLPHPLRDLHAAQDAAANAPPLGIGRIDWGHPLFRGLGGAAEASLKASRTARYFNLEVGQAGRARTLMAFDNGAPALIERLEAPVKWGSAPANASDASTQSSADGPHEAGAGRGPGRVLLLTTSVDLDFTDLPLRTAFVALLQRSTRYAAGTLAQGEAGGGQQAASPDLSESDFEKVDTEAVARTLASVKATAGLRLQPFDADGDQAPARRGYGGVLLWALCGLFICESLLVARR